MSQQIEWCSIPCALCGGKDISVLSNISRSGKPLRTVICKSCGLVWSDPRPHDARQFYEEEYRITYKHTYAPKPKHVLRAGNVSLSRLEKINQLLSGSKTILDVGSGGGEFAYLLQLLGHRVTGVEPNRGYVNYSMKEYELTVQAGFVQDCIFPPDTFEVITMWHVLEHTENPGAVLVQLCSWLKLDGYLVVEVPNVEATCQSPKSTFHEAHLYNFNVASLRGMVEKAGLHESWHRISNDGGNITMFLERKDLPITESAERAIHENFQRISEIVRGHTNFRHLLTSTPYLRALERLRRSCAERRKTASFSSGKQLLDSLYTLAVTAKPKTDAVHH